MKKTLLWMALLLLALTCRAMGDTDNEKSGKAYKLLEAAHQSFERARWKDVVQECTQALALVPHARNPLYLRGLAYEQLNDWKHAEADFKDVVHMDARDTQGWTQLIQVELMQGHYADARQYANTILGYEPRSFLAYYFLGVVYYEEGNQPKAYDNFDRSHALWKEYAPNLFNLGMVLYNMRQLNNALARMRDALNEEPRNAKYLFTTGWYTFMTGDKIMAFSLLKRAADSRDKVWSYAAKALMSMAQERYADANKEVDEALKEDPTMGKALVLKALLLAHESKKDEAVKYLNEAFDLDPLDFDVQDGLRHLGQTVPPPRPARLPGAPSTLTAPSSSPSPTPTPTPPGSPSPSPTPSPPEVLPTGSPSPTPPVTPTPRPKTLPPPPPGAPAPPR
jgi:tetratricopeptide (TPR) repeat protein